MANTPLFIADEATLKTKLRLSAMSTSNTDAQAILDEAVLRARVRFYRELGTTRVAALVAIPFDPVGTTLAATERALANTVEVKMVYCTLLRLLPNAFMDASGSVKNTWNEEALIRERGTDLEEELERCESEIQADLLSLADDVEECNDIQTFDGTADCPAPKVGLSLRPKTYPTEG